MSKLNILSVIASILEIVVCVMITNIIVSIISASSYVGIITILCGVGAVAFSVYNIIIAIRDTKVLNKIFRK